MRLTNIRVRKHCLTYRAKMVISTSISIGAENYSAVTRMEKV